MVSKEGHSRAPTLDMMPLVQLAISAIVIAVAALLGAGREPRSDWRELFRWVGRVGDTLMILSKASRFWLLIAAPLAIGAARDSVSADSVVLSDYLPDRGRFPARPWGTPVTASPFKQGRSEMDAWRRRIVAMLGALVVGLSGAAATGCGDGDDEGAAEEVGNAAEDVGKAADEAGEEADEALEDADKKVGEDE